MKKKWIQKAYGRKEMRGKKTEEESKGGRGRREGN